jgi:SAM-dependent methyltransferase
MWAGPSGQRWLSSAVRFEKTLKTIGDELLSRAALAPGQHVVDIGCGAGSMSFDIAEKVAPGGSVTSLDISPELIGEGIRRASTNIPPVPVHFILGDAAITHLPHNVDRLVSRFGSMFFTDPYGAFAHMRTFLKPGGSAALAVWAPLKFNPWMLEMRTILAANFELPVVPPRTPGPFAFDEPDYLRDILGKGGFSKIDIVQWNTQMYVGGPDSSPKSAADFLMNALSMAQRAIDATEEVRNKIEGQLVARLENYNTAHGVCMPASVFFATASA